MSVKKYLNLALRVMDGDHPSEEDLRMILSSKEEDLIPIMLGADWLRSQAFGRSIHLCTICNGKSGGCTENCSFCPQSCVSQAKVPRYPLLTVKELVRGGDAASQAPIHRYSIVTSGKRVSHAELEKVAEAISEMAEKPIDVCASLGILDAEDLRLLKQAGLSRFHHNLETAKSYFSQICTTHTYEERVETIQKAKKEGLSICAGGIFGIGETDDQIIELALALKELDVDAIPINFFIPVRGTPLEKTHALIPTRCLKIIAVFRYLLPEKEIIVCGGRMYHLEALHPMIFYAGASGIMTGDYLTTKGRSLKDDLALLECMGFHPRARTADVVKEG